MTGIRPTLGRALIRVPTRGGAVQLPHASQLELPDRAIQFGTGGFLRGFLDDLLDGANRRGQFDGRVVMIGSTGSGRDRRLNEQDGLFTIVEQGLVNGTPRRELRVVAAVSRAVDAATDWREALRCAEHPALESIFSNTTERGIVLDEADAAAGAERAHRSFPARLASLLLHRARHFAFAPTSAPIVIPCELVEDNGDRLRDAVRTLARRWALEQAFVRWLDDVPFCNTLVDRIVQGAPTAEQAAGLAAELGYEDAMITICEPYRLFVIEAAPAIRARLRFSVGDDRVILTDDVAPYRERKLRLLNGTHTALAPLGLLAGCRTVAEAMAHPLVGAFARALLFDEILPTVAAAGADAFAREVVERFANPFMHHALWDITLQGGTKLRVRLVPVLLDAARRTGRTPRALALGVAAYLALQRRGADVPSRDDGRPAPPDVVGDAIHARWAGVADEPHALAAFVRAVAADAAVWGTDLAALPGFVDRVSEHLLRLRTEGAHSTLTALLAVPA